MHKDLEIMKSGTDDVNAMAALNCCWPPGTESAVTPEPEIQ